MGHSYFTDKAAPPSDDAIQAALGPAQPLWYELIAALQEGYVCGQELKYLYGKKYGWALRFRSRAKLLINLYPAEGHLVAQVNLDPGAVECALTLGLGALAGEAIARAHPYPEGRWVFVPVRSAEDFDDVLRMVALRAEDQRIPRREP